VTRRDYCQYLLVSPINDTLTNVANHCEPFSHAAIHRYWGDERVTLRLVWENVRGQVVPAPCGDVLFDDTVLDKHAACAIALVRRQYSGNGQAVSKGIGVVPCVYVKPWLDQCWLSDDRLSDPQGDGKSKRDHGRDLLIHIVSQKPRPFEAVLMDTWYATRDLMWCMESLRKFYYCPLKDHRQVDDSGGTPSYRRVDSLAWSPETWAHGQTIKINGFPKDPTVRLCRVEVSTHRTAWVVTNDPTPEATEATPETCGFRWKIEPWHRDGTQVTGLERGQCRKARIQRHHSGCAVLGWVRLKTRAAQTGRTVYQLKHGWLDDYLIQQLKSPSLKMVLA
jgi:hypothetical protein